MPFRKLPLVTFLGIIRSSEEGKLLELPFSEKLVNHVNTYHASVIYSLAEISSGELLSANFPNELQSTFSVVRSSTIKYMAIPQNNLLYTRGHFTRQTVAEIHEQLDLKGKVPIDIQIEVFDISDKLIGVGKFQWFVQLKSESLKISKTAPLT